jgi:hypothetical protein
VDADIALEVTWDLSLGLLSLLEPLDFGALK